MRNMGKELQRELLGLHLDVVLKALKAPVKVLIRLVLQPWQYLKRSRQPREECQSAFDLLLVHAISAYMKSKWYVPRPLTHHRPVLPAALSLWLGSSAISVISSDLELSCCASCFHVLTFIEGSL